jgi:hypothetical protein
MGTIEYHDIAVQTISELSHVSPLKPGSLYCGLPWVFSKRKLFLMQGTT